jgi:DNA-binding NtrC family response regulator
MKELQVIVISGQDQWSDSLMRFTRPGVSITLIKHSELFSATDMKNVSDMVFLDLDSNSKHPLGLLLKAQSCFKSAPVIAFSSASYLNLIRMAFDHGASLFVPKRVLLNNMEGTMNYIIFRNWERSLARRNPKKFVINHSLNGSVCLHSY